MLERHTVGEEIRMTSLIRRPSFVRLSRGATCAAIAFAATACGSSADVDGEHAANEATALATQVAISSALRLSAASVDQGGTISGTVTYKNTGTSPVTIEAIVIAGRPPGGTHTGGPFDDFSPNQKTITLKAGGTVTVAASRVINATDPIGKWESYPTYKDSTGVWHD